MRNSDVSILALHGTGFCSGVWRETIEQIDGGMNWVVPDLPGHGRCPEIVRPTLRELARWAHSQIGNREDFIVVGHSFGATIAMAVAAQVSTCIGCIAIEPILPNGDSGSSDVPSLIAGALSRRRWFDSPKSFEERLLRHPKFRNWRAAAVSAYSGGGLVPDGKGWRLACRVECEIDMYTAATDGWFWEVLPSLLCPVMVIWGTESARSPELVERLRSLVNHAEESFLPGASHFVPMEQPVELARTVRTWLARSVLRNTERAVR